DQRGVAQQRAPVPLRLRHARARVRTGRLRRSAARRRERQRAAGVRRDRHGRRGARGGDRVHRGTASVPGRMNLAGRIRVGIVGAGEIVARGHLPVLVNLPEVEVAWIHDRDAARAAAVARAYRIPPATAASAADLPAADVVLLGIPYGARWSYYDAL